MSDENRPLRQSERERGEVDRLAGLTVKRRRRRSVHVWFIIDPCRSSVPTDRRLFYRLCDDLND